METKVLLIFHFCGDKKTSIEVLPPLGILSIAAYLENKKIKTDVIDFTINPDSVIDIESYDIIGFSINISNRENTLKEIEKIRKVDNRVKIIVGGPLCMSNPEIFLNKNIDAVFTCEGEEALYEYITKEDKKDVAGIYLKDNEKYIYTGDRELLKNLDDLPFPAFNKVDIRKYNNYPKRRRPISTMITSRGCPYKCIFCSHTMGRKWRARSAENVVEEIKWQVRELGVREILIYDDNFSLNRKRAEKICDLLIHDKIKIKLQFSNGLRVDNLDYALLIKLKTAGTWFIGLAPETGNPEIMKRIKKGFDHDKVLQIRNICRQLGIKTHGFFMIGFPFENKTTILETIAFAKKLDCEIVEFNKVIPYSKTELFEMLENEGGVLNTINKVKSYHEGTITTHKVGDLPEAEVKWLIRKAYRSYYLRVNKIIDLLFTFSIRDLIELGIYALRTRNI
jgi:anaerobic magnesium-protoporphyrin IX monomethyl ester cyclase